MVVDQLTLPLRSYHQQFQQLNNQLFPPVIVITLSIPPSSEHATPISILPTSEVDAIEGAVT